QRVNTAFLERYAAGRLENEPYSPDRLERARRGMLALGPFASVRVRAADRLDATGRLPTTFTVAERARHAIGINAAYETNYGPSVRAYWEHRNLFGGAERLRVEAEVARIGTGGAIGEETYRFGATYRDPGLLGRDLTLVASLFALRERLEAYDRDAIAGTVLFEQRLSERLFVQAGPTADFGQSGPTGGPLTPYQIAGVTFGGRYDGTDSLLDPSRGWRANGAVTPSWSFSTNGPFAPLRATSSVYWDVLGDRRTILAARGTFGSLLGSALSDVPRHLRFYAGGGGSVRGYDYQSIGPRDAANRISGGASLVEASVEWRQRVWGDIGAVAFVDAGSVGTSSAPDTSNLRFGAGFGVRYHTPIGPIRADVGFPLVKQRGSSAFGLYVGIGQAF
ncbi:MAG: BamA/TamA family outer membrane protein, partial [Acetobacteraceae bacterium]|nr:BamA/TamA family outer membrane protein [Acetobacteraceae bacterium]